MSYYLVDIHAAVCARHRATRLRMQARILEGAPRSAVEVPLELDTPPIFEAFVHDEDEAMERIRELEHMAMRQGFAETAVRMFRPGSAVVSYDCTSERITDHEVN